MDPRKINIHDYSYVLPEEKIAKYPLPERDTSKLLVYRKGNITSDFYYNISHHLTANSLMVFNNTRVVEARLLFQKPSGGVIEVFCLEPAGKYSDITSGMSQQGTVLWKCLIGGASKWKYGMTLEKKVSFETGELILFAKIVERNTDSFIIELSWQPESFSFAEVLHFAGAIPLPPYIKREVEESDRERYQTIYAIESGSVAAPTAGLHFSDKIFKTLELKNIRREYITLHVGAGTFKQVKSETMADHEMHAEFFEVQKEFIASLLFAKDVIAVGTTTARTLESLYWLGVKLSINPSLNEEEMKLQQWEAYELPQDVPADEAISSLINWMERKQIQVLITKTSLLIAPGYKLRVIHALVTNFHQPQSTLLLLVAAVAGPQWKKIYDFALQNDFRLLSYGDGCLIYVD